ncbi:MAG: phosphatidylglycerophosphatase [Phycisphaerae bacterium]|nr:phosphatidylglycerophosphatase [Phycisphaerae bacterium]
MQRFRAAFLTVGGLGHAPIASGTFGSLPAVCLAFLLVQFGQQGIVLELSMILLAVIFSIACLRFGRESEELFGKKDPGQVVADEVAGQAIALLWLPWASPESPGALARNMAIAASAFLAFRFFDIVKPPPARGLQRLGGGLGILIDDLIAGAMALVVVQVIFRLVVVA